MKARTYRRHFRESFKSLGRNGWMMFASASAVTITLLLVGVFFTIIMNMNKFASDLEKDVDIRVFVDLSAKQADEDKLQKQLEQIDGVKSVTYSSKEEQLKDLVKSMGKDYELFEQSNPLYNVFVVKADNPNQTKEITKQINKFDHVEDAKYGEKKVDNLFHVLRISRNVGLVLIAGLLLTAMFLISNTIKITIFARRKEIEIMKLVGATNWFIRWPFILEGLWLGVLGSIIPILIVCVGYFYLSEYLAAKLQSQVVQILSANPFTYEVGAVLLLLGVLIGIWGSTMSIRRFLKV